MTIIVSLIVMLCTIAFTTHIIKIVSVSIIETEKTMKGFSGEEKSRYALRLIRKKVSPLLKPFFSRKCLKMILEKVFIYIKEAFIKGGE